MTEIISDVQAGACAPAPVKLPTRAAGLAAAGISRPVRVGSLTSGPATVKGTGMPDAGARTHVQLRIFGPKPIRSPYNYKTRVDALGGGAVGPHPAREPGPV